MSIEFIGTETSYPLANGKQQRRIHLDGAASPLVMRTASEAMAELWPHYSNSHSNSHASANICGQALEWAHQRITQISGADQRYCCVFMGSGSTSPINNLARRLRIGREQRDVVLVSAMEHHANDLPHRQHYQVEHMPLAGESTKQGAIDLSSLRKLFEQYGKRINYVAFSAVSNVTGIVNPVKEIIAMAHEYGAYALVDAAQMAAHMPLNVADTNADFVVFSGHKVYCAGSPGVIIAKRDLLAAHPSDEVGGGIVSHVSYQDHEFVNNYPTREQAGTKNIIGAYALARVMEQLDSYGWQKIQQHGESIWQQAYTTLAQIDGITIYGDSNQPRIGALSFNINDIDHGLAAAVLSDYFGIALRNECFCAHPYVSAMLKQQLWELDLDNIPDDQHEAYINRKRGMLRASFSLYTTQQDILALHSAIVSLIENIDDYRQHYEALEDGSYRHKTFALDWQDFVTPNWTAASTATHKEIKAG